MSNKKKTHYNIDALDSKGCLYNLAFGSRSDGKSYQVKHKKMVKKYIETGRRFILLRRWQEEIKSEKIEQYFSDVDVTGLTKGRYNCIVMYKKQLYFASYDFDNNKTVRGEKIGYVMSLNAEQHYAGASYLDVDDIIFEEFIARTPYISGEPDKLVNLWSTIDRKRYTTRLWMVGNTISRVCPYINEWGLHKLISNMKQGEIKTTKIPAGEDEDGQPVYITMAVEHCKSTGTNLAIGKHKDMLNTGSWQSDPQPHLPKSLNEYTSRFSFIFMYQDFKFVCSYLEDNETGETCWFIKPFDGEIRDDSIVISDQVRVSPLWQRNIYDTNFKNPRLNQLFQNFPILIF
jgi:hypothetical protein